MPVDGVGEMLGVLHSVLPGGVNESNPERVYARTSLAGGPSRFFLLQVDPSGANPALPPVVNQIDVDGAGTADLSIRITPQQASAPPGGTAERATIEVRPINPGQPLARLELDIGVRTDAPLVPPDNSPNARFVVLGHDTGTPPLVRTLLIDTLSEETGTPNTVGHRIATTASIVTDAGGSGAAADHPLVLRLEDRTGQSGTQQATVANPTIPIQTTVDISVPVAGSVSAHSRTRGELLRPGLRPHLDGAGVELSLAQQVRAVVPTGTTDRTSVGWASPHQVALVLVVDDLVSGRHSVADTATLPNTLALDVDPLRDPPTNPHVQLTASAPLTSLRLRDEQPAESGRFRHLAATIEGIPPSLGLRLDADPGERFRLFISEHSDVSRPLPSPLGAAAVLLGRDAGQLPPSAGGLPTALAIPRQGAVFDFDDVRVGHPFLLPRMLGSVRALTHLGIEQATPAPVPVHADANGGLVVGLELGTLSAPTGGQEPERSLRLQVFSQVDPEPDETGPVHTRLLVRAGELPSTTLVDLRATPPTDPGDPGYFGLRVWGACRFVHALFLDRASGPLGVDGHPRRLHVSVPRTPAEFADVRRDAAGIFASGSEPLDFEIDLASDDPIDEAELLTRALAALRFDREASLPAVADGLEINAAGAGLSGRVAVTGGGLAPRAVRATPQASVLQRPESEERTLTEAVTARVYGVTHLRQGGVAGAADEQLTRVLAHLDPGRVNRALRVRQRERLDVTDPGREALKVRVADVPAVVEVATIEGPPSGDEGLDARTSRRSANTVLSLSAPSGPAVLYSESRERAFDGPRTGSDVGTGVLWLSIDSLPRTLVFTPLHSGRYAMGETRPRNWSDIPKVWTRDGLRIQTSDPLAIREMLKASWDRDSSSGSHSAWSLIYVRMLELALDPVTEGEELGRLWLWNPGLRPPAGGSFDEPEAVLGVRVGEGVRATLDLDRFEQRTTEPTIHWDALPGGGWDLLAEIQLDAYGGEVSVGSVFGLVDPVKGGGGPGEWWVRATDKWPSFLGGGSVAVGNTSGPHLHKDRIFL